MGLDYLSNCKLLTIGLIGLLSFSLFLGTTVAAEVYWAARDKGITGTGIGNHHLVLVVPDNPDELPEEIQKMLRDLGGGKKGFTLAAFEKRGRLQFESNNNTDLRSLLEHFDPEKYKTEYDYGYNFEKNKVEPPNGMTDAAFIELQVQLARNYETNEAQNNVEYDLWDQNCATWVNTLFKVAGVGEHERERTGEFSGVDWGEEDLLDESLFIPQPHVQCSHCDGGWVTEPCSECEGTGVVQEDCPNCYGSGTMYCSGCGGTGTVKVQCSHCDGTGLLECSYCDTTGIVQEYCSNCYGGIVEVQCSHCDGGWVRELCRNCSGIGTVQDYCSACDGRGIIVEQCPHCDGGWVEGELCSYCDTSGIVQEYCSDCVGGIIEVQCSHCDGGWVTEPCSGCGGIGIVQEYCSDCGGTGIVEVQCSHCWGRGWVDCSYCEGIGVVQEDCPNCYGSGTLACSDCGGTRIVEVQCSHCDGGWVTELCPVCGGDWDSAGIL